MARKYFRAARSMPPLPHKLPGQEFSITKSPAVEWLLNQPEIRQALFDLVRENKLIVYDAETGLWKGVDYPHG